MVKELNNNKNRNGVKLGRPKGSTNRHAISLINQINLAIEEAVQILPTRHGVTLAEILADSLKANPTATLQAIGKYCPPDINVNVQHSPFTEALQTINDRIMIIDNDIDEVQEV